MATVTNVQLEIGRADDRNRRRVEVRWTVCFSRCEGMAGSVFRERVVLRGDDPGWDDHLITLRSDCVRASQGCAERRLVRTVASSTLDEDPDTIILGWVIGNKDEVYAEVCLEPFEPSGSCGRSTVLTADFGPAGAG